MIMGIALSICFKCSVKNADGNRKCSPLQLTVRLKKITMNSVLLQGYIAFEIYQYVVCSTTKEQFRQVQNRRSDTDQSSRKIV